MTVNQAQDKELLYDTLEIQAIKDWFDKVKEKFQVRKI